MEKRFPPGAEVWCSLRKLRGIVLRIDRQLELVGTRAYGHFCVYVLYENSIECIYTYAQACDILEVTPLRGLRNSVATSTVLSFPQDHQFYVSEKVRELSTHSPGTITKVSRNPHGNVLVLYQNGVYKKYTREDALILLGKRKSDHLQCVL